MYRCSLCGQTLEFLSEYHANMHNMSLREYKEKNIAKKISFRDMQITKTVISEVSKYMSDTLKDRTNRKLKRNGKI